MPPERNLCNKRNSEVRYENALSIIVKKHFFLITRKNIYTKLQLIVA